MGITLQILHASDLEGGVDAIENAPNFAAIVDILEDEFEYSVTLSSGDNIIPGPFFNAAGLIDDQIYNDFYNDFFGLTDEYQSLEGARGRIDISIMNAIGFDAAALGNHEFDAGTDALGDIVRAEFEGAGLADDEWVGAQFPYLAANLDVSNDGNLNPLFTEDILPSSAFESGPDESLAAADVPKLAEATVIEVDGSEGVERIGVVGAVTPFLDTISSPGDTTVSDPGAGTADMALLAQNLQPAIDKLADGVDGVAGTDDDVDKIVLTSHLQDIALERELIGLLSGVDVVVAGGSETLLADDEDVARGLQPGDAAEGPYPLTTTEDGDPLVNADGDPAVIVNTADEYGYVGRLVVEFDDDGVIVPGTIDEDVSGAFATTDDAVLALDPDADADAATDGIQYADGKAAQVQSLTDAVSGVVESQDGNIFGETAVYLEGRRDIVRSEETNLGNLTADANLAAARSVDESVAVSLKNGGGIRSSIGSIGDNGELLPPEPNPAAGKEAGEISQLDIDNTLRFNNGLTLITLTAEQLKQVIELGVEQEARSLLQIGGAKFSYDPAKPAGERVETLALVDETGEVAEVVVQDGAIVGDPARGIRIVTLDFLAEGGSGYPYRDFVAADPAFADVVELDGEDEDGDGVLDPGEDLNLNGVLDEGEDVNNNGVLDIDEDTNLNGVLDGPAIVEDGGATFTRAGGEQDALAEYLLDTFAEEPFAEPDTPEAGDERIQNLQEREDAVLPGDDGPFTLQILHASDLEGGVDAIDRAPNFAALVDALEDEFANTLTLSGGDNVIPGPFFNAALFADDAIFNEAHNAVLDLPPGAQYEALEGARGRIDISIMNVIGFDASALGNHEFDLGTDTLSDLIRPDFGGAGLADDEWIGTLFPYLSANLDFSNDGNISDLATDGIVDGDAFLAGPDESAAADGGAAATDRLAPAAVFERGGEEIGVVGATTPLLATISSPGATEVEGPTTNDMEALAAELQPVVDDILAGDDGIAGNADDVNKVILVSHLQQLALEEELIGLLEGVDVVVASGSDTLLADDEDVARGLRPGDRRDGDYPIVTENADGDTAVIVSTDGEYSYVGRLVVEFDEQGRVIADSIDEDVSGAFATTDAVVEAVDPDADTDASAEGIQFADGSKAALVRDLVEGVSSVVDEQDGNTFGSTDVFLDGRRSEVRTEETNLGNLTADANLAAARQVDDSVLVSFKNGGGIRAPIGETDKDGTLLPPQGNPDVGKGEGEVSQLDITNALRFNNGLTLITLTPEQLLQVLEHAVSATEAGATPGQFPQVGGIAFSFDPDGDPGERIGSAALLDEDGNPTRTVVQDGKVVEDAPEAIRIVTLDFLAGGGDGYPYPQFVAADPDFADVVALEDEAAGIGGAADFAPAGSEQDALAEYFAENFPSEAEAFDEAETDPSEDRRVVNLGANDLLAIGTGGDDVLEGTVDDDTILGLDGDDDISGFAGDDEIDGDAGDDVVRGGEGDDELDGDEGEDALYGDAGDDELDGGEGDDLLVGGAGDDEVDGDDGDDLIVAGEGDDELDGGDGTDTADFSGLAQAGGAAASAAAPAETAAGVEASLEDGEATYRTEAGTFTDELDDIENLVGTAADDRLTGDDGDNVIEAGAGDDELIGLDGDDLLVGGEGEDLLDGGEGTDTADFSDLAGGVEASLADGTASVIEAQGSLGFIGEQTVETGTLTGFNRTEVGGLSGIDYDPLTGSYVALSDDRSTIDPARFYQVTLDFDADSFDGVQFVGTTLLRDEDGSPFAAGAVDPESIRITEDRTLLWTSEGDADDGIDPFVREMDGFGAPIREFDRPEGFSPTDDGSSGIRDNLAFESLTITPDGATAFAATENALFQDGPAASLDEGSPSRVVRYDVATGAVTGQFVYPVDPIPDEPVPADAFATNGLVELLALDDTSFVAVERAFSVGVGNTVRLYLTTLEGAGEVEGPDGVDDDVQPMTKVLLADLADFGISPDNIEGITFGPEVDGKRTIVLVSDNNFNETQTTQFLAFTVEGDLALVTETDRLVEIENLTGTAFADMLAGDDLANEIRGLAGNDVINGLGGDDTLFGGAGDNVIDGGEGDDRAVFDGDRREFVITREGETVVVTGRDGKTRLDNVETLVFDDIETPVTDPSDGGIELSVLGRFESGVFDESAAEIVAHDPASQRLFLSNGDSGTVDVLSIADPTAPSKEFSIDPEDDLGPNGGINSVAVSAGLIAVAIEAETQTDTGQIAFYTPSGFFLGALEVGALPDSIAFTPDGSKLLVANEGEPDDGVDPLGSVSIVDLADGLVDATVETLDFTGFEARAEELKEAGLRIFPGKSLAEDVEPEFIAVSEDGSTAFVTLQENNAVAVVDLTINTITDIQPLGAKDHGIPGNGLDTSDEDGAIAIGPAPVFGLFQPDAIASYTAGGETFYVTANEGDSRDEDVDIEDVALDPEAFPNADALQAEENLGALEISNIDGDTDGDGDFDQLFAFGARSFSIWDEAGNLVFDSADDFERITAEAFPDFFNSDNDENSFDTRSDNKGPEPEGVTLGEIDGQTYAFVGLERVGGVMVYDVTNPYLPEFVQYINPRDFTGDPEAGTAGDLGPEGLIFIAPEDSPNGDPLLVVTNEVSGSTTIYEIDVTEPVPAVAINEIRVNQPGDDTNEFFELAGEAGTSLDGLTYLVIGDGQGGSGTIEAVVDLTGQAIPDDGFFLAAEGGFAPADLVDLVADLNFENGDNVTHLLVSGFTGSDGDDLDTDDDGVPDVEPWDAVVDSVALIESETSGDQVYSDTVVGPDGSFAPGQVFRETDRTGAFGIGDFDFGVDDTPGESNEVPPPPMVGIPAIQGAGHVSPFRGEEVTTTGIVTAVADNGFYMQDPDGDGDDATSDGIFVFTGGAPTVAKGDELRVTGEVSEFVPGGFDTGNLSSTQFAFPDIEVLSSGNDLPEAVVLGSSGRVVPTDTVISEDEIPIDPATGEPAVRGIDLRDPADGNVNFDPAEDGIDFFESVEGMLVTVEDPVAVSATNRFGETWTLTNQGANISPADARTERDGIDLGINLAADADGYGDLNPERVQIQFDGDLLPDGFDAPDITNGDVVSDVTGVVGYSFGNFEVLVTEEFAVDAPSGIAPEVTDLVGTEDQLTVASYNVLNVTANTDDDDADGDDLDADQIARLAEHIVDNLGTPDILALQEIQDDSGETDDGTLDATATLEAVVAAIEAAGGPLYEFVGAVVDEDGENGGVPGGNIRNAFLWNPDRVSADDDDFLTLESDVLADEFSVTDANAFDGTRDPLLGVFEFGGEEITLINNHLSSRFGSDPIYGGPQLFLQAGEDARAAQTATLNEVVDAILADDPEAEIAVLGDLNTFEFTDELAEILPGTGDDRVLDNLITEAITEDDVYTFLFQGNSQVLDHVFVTDGLLETAEADIVHVNTDFPFLSDQVASDHEPVVARFDFGEGADDLEVAEGEPGEGSPPAERASVALDVRFLGSEADYDNVFGWYDAATGDAGVIFEALHDVAPQTGKTVEVTADAPEDIGFFLIPDGARKIADLIDDEPDISVVFAEGKVELAGADRTEKLTAWFTDESLNSDGKDHAVGADGRDDQEDGPLGAIAWEDLRGGGDEDFDDAVLSVAAANDDDWQAFLADAAAARAEEKGDAAAGTAHDDDYWAA
jgi:2',3'-cyclic-nucleotide 2'-phosphodiesterase (5'-nucleotidase family)/endonuclease/exonuclease/phosphatase family metal-dependent hydrolase